MKNRVAIVYLSLFFISLLMMGWAVVFPITGNEMGYSILNYYIIFPLASLICGYKAGRNGRTYKKWLLAPFAGLLYFLMPVVTFHNMDYSILAAGMVPAAIGIVIGSYRRHK